MTLALQTRPFLETALDTLRPMLADRSIPVGERLRDLWAGAVACRDFGAADIIQTEFLQLAYDVGLAADLGRSARADLEHVIRFALLDQNPFN